MTKVKFASFGSPTGRCGAYQQGKCHAQKSWDPFQAVSEIFLLKIF